MVGVYKIENIVNGFCYIGATRNAPSRFQVHVSELKRDCHHCSLLQKDFNNQKLEDFTFSIIEECNEEDLSHMELKWINFYHSKDKLYNTRLIQKPKGKDSIETRVRKSLSMRGNKNGQGRIVTEEQKLKLRDLNLGKKMSESSKLKMREAKLGKESRKKIEIEQIDLNTGEVINTFKSATDASKFLNTSRPNIVKALKGERKNVLGFGWRYSALVVDKSGELLENLEEDNQQPS